MPRLSQHVQRLQQSSTAHTDIDRLTKFQGRVYRDRESCLMTSSLIIKTAKVPKFQLFAVCVLSAVLIATLGSTTTGALPSGTITTCAELQAINDDLTADYVLGNDIDCDVAPFNTGSGFEPIGQGIGSFSGSLDGQDHSIIGLMVNITTNNNAGLFSMLDGAASIHDIGFLDANISTSVHYAAGIIAGVGGGTLENIYVSGEVSGAGDYVGAIVGEFNGTLDNVGSSANVEGNYYVGGLVGYLHNNEVERSYATGDVTASTDYVGGAFGYTYESDVYEVYSTGDVTGEAYVGGFVGAQDSSFFYDTYSRGDVTGNGDYVGGFAGLPDGFEITNSYSTGFVSNDDDGTTYEGGFSGYDNSAEIYSFWDIDTSGTSVTYGGGAYGLTTVEMTDVQYFTETSTPGLDTPWDFAGNPNDDVDDEDIWDINPGLNDGYPFLTFEPYSPVPGGEEEDEDDLDGISAEIENAAPNGGDANNDGTHDSEQGHVASFPSSITSQYVVVQSSGECNVSTPSIEVESTTKPDIAYKYPVGLVNFTFAQCDPGTTTATLFFYNLNNDNFVPRKFNSTNGTYATITGATVTQVNIAGINVTKVTYQLVDGGPLDADGTINGSIVDPVGLGQAVVGAPRTGGGGTAQ